MKNKGVSLVETIVGIVILGFALTGASMLMQASIVQSKTNNNRIQAIYTAQKCLEISRNMRDSAWYQSRPWNCPFQPQLHDTNVCKNVPVFTNEIQNFFKSQTQERFTINTNVVPKFIDPNKDPQGYEITCRVSWDEYSIENTHILTNWLQK